MKNKYVWNFRPTLDRIEIFFLYDALIALCYFTNHKGFGGPEVSEIVLALLLVINGPLFLLFAINLILELLRKCGKVATWRELSVVTALFLIAEWYVVIGGFGIGPAFQYYVLLLMAGTLLCFFLVLYCLLYPRIQPHLDR